MWIALAGCTVAEDWCCHRWDAEQGQRPARLSVRNRDRVRPNSDRKVNQEVLLQSTLRIAGNVVFTAAKAMATSHNGQGLNRWRTWGAHTSREEHSGSSVSDGTHCPTARNSSRSARLWGVRPSSRPSGMRDCSWLFIRLRRA